jgi:hypothetical protein
MIVPLTRLFRLCMHVCVYVCMYVCNHFVCMCVLHHDTLRLLGDCPTHSPFSSVCVCMYIFTLYVCVYSIIALCGSSMIVPLTRFFRPCTYVCMYVGVHIYIYIYIYIYNITPFVSLYKPDTVGVVSPPQSIQSSYQHVTVHFEGG